MLKTEEPEADAPVPGPEEPSDDVTEIEAADEPIGESEADAEAHTEEGQ